MFFDRLRTLNRARAFYEVENFCITSLVAQLTLYLRCRFLNNAAVLVFLPDRSLWWSLFFDLK